MDLPAFMTSVNFCWSETNLFNIENVLDSEEIDVNEFETLGFGKYKKKDIRWVEENDPEYLVWLICSSVANKQKITLSDNWIRYIIRIPVIDFVSITGLSCSGT